MKFVRYVSCDDMLREFGARIGALRLAQNLSRADVACAAGVRVRNLARLEVGRGPVEFIEFVRVCLVLGLGDRIPGWVPEVPREGVARTQRSRVRKRASKKAEPDPDPDEAPEAHWAHVRWIWES